MDYTLCVIQFLNSLQLGILLFLVASGLTLVFRILDFVNLAHGSVYVLGAFICTSLTFALGNFVYAHLISLAIVAVPGRNGMGKTTTMNSRMRILPKSSGSIEFDGQNTTRWPSHRVAKFGLGLMPEDRQIFPNLKAHGKLIATARQHAQRGRIWDAERVYALFPELAARKSRIKNLLPGGEQKNACHSTRTDDQSQIAYFG